MSDDATRARREEEAAIEQFLGRALQAGVILAAAIALFGAVLFFARYGHQHAAFSVFTGEPARLRTIAGVLSGALHLQSRAVVQLGLLTLIATPVARVALSLVAFARQRDWLYVVITGAVLTLLLVSLTAGGA